MRFSGEMHNGRRLVPVEQLPDRLAVGDVALHEDIGRVAADRLERIEIAGVGELVEVDDPALRSAIDSRTKQLPMKPAPPVTRMVCMVDLSGRSGITPFSRRERDIRVSI